ncbi:MAG: TolC family protein [Flavobacteriales bacterium]
MMKNLTSLFIVISLFGNALAEAQEAKSFSLQEAMDYAVQHNYQLQQAKFDVDISKRKVKETTAIGLPQVNGEASYNNYIDIPTQVAPATAFNPAADADQLVPLRFGLPHSMSAGITASQLIFDGSYFVGLRAAKEYVKASEFGLQRSEIEVKNSVAQTYYSALAAMENIAALKENKANIERIYSETSALFDAGFLEKQDADQMRLLRSNTSNQLDFAERQLDNILNMLKLQMGIDIKENITLSDDIETIVTSQSDGSISLLDQPFSADRHIDFKSLEQSQKLSELSLSNERARYYPQLSAFFNHSQNAYRREFDFYNNSNWYPTTLWGVQLKVPLFSSLQGHQRVQQSKLELAKIQSQKTQLEQSLSMQALNAKSNYKSALDRYDNVKEDLELAKSIKERTRIKYNEGLASSTDLTTAENQYLTSLGNYINTTLELLNSKLALDKALGN